MLGCTNYYVRMSTHRIIFDAAYLMNNLLMKTILSNIDNNALQRVVVRSVIGVFDGFQTTFFPRLSKGVKCPIFYTV